MPDRSPKGAIAPAFPRALAFVDASLPMDAGHAADPGALVAHRLALASRLLAGDRAASRARHGALVVWGRRRGDAA